MSLGFKTRNFSADSFAWRSADKAHGIARTAVFLFADPVNRDDAGMFQPARDAGFAQETSPAFLVVERGGQDSLQRHLPVEDRIARQQHLAQAAASVEVNDLIRGPRRQAGSLPAPLHGAFGYAQDTRRLRLRETVAPEQVPNLAFITDMALEAVGSFQPALTTGTGTFLFGAASASATSTTQWQTVCYAVSGPNFDVSPPVPCRGGLAARV